MRTQVHTEHSARNPSLPLSPTSLSLSPTKQSSRHGDLTSEKKALSNLSTDVPQCIKLDVCYNLGYLSGYSESASFWSFFTQWNELLLRLDGSSLPRCMIEIFIATTLGLIAALLTDPRLEWTPRMDCSDAQLQRFGADICDDGLPLLHEFTNESSSTGHALLGGLLGCACQSHRPPLRLPLSLRSSTAVCVQFSRSSDPKSPGQCT